MGTEFITQKWLFRVTDEKLAEQTLQWAGIDPALYPDVVQSYIEDTSPANTTLSGDDEEIGYVEPHRRGEGFVVDEFRRHARAKFLGAPTAELAEDLDSTAPTECRMSAHTHPPIGSPPGSLHTPAAAASPPSWPSFTPWRCGR